MTNDFIQCMQVILTQSFKLLTCFKLPGVNFTPAVMLFGILSFGLAIVFVKGIMNTTAQGLTNSASSYVSKRQAINTEKRSRGVK